MRWSPKTLLKLNGQSLDRFLVFLLGCFHFLFETLDAFPRRLPNIVKFCIFGLQILFRLLQGSLVVTLQYCHFRLEFCHFVLPGDRLGIVQLLCRFQSFGLSLQLFSQAFNTSMQFCHFCCYRGRLFGLLLNLLISNIVGGYSDCQLFLQTLLVGL
mmetsp:Transcript_131109/g.379292  ORF Transcript_131109/g.379292 Transcript_131109/m.379292 type:complete len:156 (-) Transcript_131109:604-1071(-)